MQMMKKCFSLILTLAMLLGMLVLPVNAEAMQEIIINPGERKEIEMPGESQVNLLFTPTESAYYIFYTAEDNPFGWWGYFEEMDADGSKQLNPAQWSDSTYAYRGEVLYAEAGKTYRLEVNNFGTDTINGFFTLVKAENYETFELDCETYKGYPGTVFSLYLTTGPDNAYETVTWTSSNPQVAALGARYSNGIEIKLGATGTAIVTASTDCGNSVSCVVTVKEPDAIAVGETKDFALEGFEETRYHFTPLESGRYILYIPRGGSCYHSIYEGTEIDDYGSTQLYGTSWSGPEDKFYGFAVDLTARQTYTIRVRESYGNGGQNGSLTLLKAATYESIKIQELYQPKVGDETVLEAEGAPSTASEKITWSTSDPEIAEIYIQDPYVILKLKAPGTATITATADSGTSDSYTFTVQDIKALDLADTVDVTLEPNNYAYFSFTPAETGRYIFYAPADAWLGFHAEDRQQHYPVCPSTWTSADGTYSGDAFELTAGMPYRISAYIRGEQKETVTTKLSIVKAADFDTFALSRVTMNRYVGDYDRVDIVGTPNFASEAVIWDSSDPSVVAIVGGYDSYTYLDSVGPGTATVTATSATGKVATCNITVREPVQMETNVEYTGTVDAGYFIPCDFTAPEDGIYTFAALGEGNYYVTAWDQEDQYVEGEGTYHRRGVRCETFEMKAGETLRFNLHNEKTSETEFRFMIGNKLKATHITLPIAEETVYVGHTFQLRVFYEPILAMEETATWEISNPEVITLRNTHYSPDEGGYEYYEFLTLKTGTATLTATSESGLKASCVIHVAEAPEIGLGKHTTKPLFAESYTLGFHQVDEFVFIPEVTGEYNLYWEKDSIDESTFFYWYGYYTELEVTKWENEYYCGLRVQLEIPEGLDEAEKELEELEKELEAMPEGSKKEQKKLELENKKWEFEELNRGFYTRVNIHNATMKPTQITFYLEAYTGEEPTIHFHAPVYVAEKSAAFAEDGMKAHYACECGTLFADEAGTTIVEAADLLIPKLIQVEDGKAEIDKEAINNAVAEVEQGGEVSIPVADAGAGSEEEVKSAALPVESLTQITEKEATLTVEMPAATVTMDTAALAAVVEKAGENASVTLEVVEVPEEDLTETQMAAIEKLDQNLVTAISAELLVNNQAIASEADGGFGGGKVTVKIPVKLSSKDFQVVYIADDGSTTVIENATYADGVLTLELEHFSTYAIVQDSMLGDTDGNGKIQTNDAKLILQHIVRMPVELNLDAADVDGNGKIQTNDAKLILQYIVKIITKFPIEA